MGISDSLLQTAELQCFIPVYRASVVCGFQFSGKETKPLDARLQSIIERHLSAIQGGTVRKRGQLENQYTKRGEEHSTQETIS